MPGVRQTAYSVVSCIRKERNDCFFSVGFPSILSQVKRCHHDAFTSWRGERRVRGGTHLQRCWILVLFHSSVERDECAPRGPAVVRLRKRQWLATMRRGIVPGHGATAARVRILAVGISEDV